MDSIYLNFAGFFVGAAIIIWSGTRLSRYGDQLADMLGWGKMFMGIILIAGITSLPELLSGISSVAIIDAPDLAVGDIVGSCAFNILIISIMDIFYDPEKTVTSAAQTGHVIAASFGIIMLSAMGLAIIKPEIFGKFGWFGGFSVVFLVLYIFAIRVVFLFEKKQTNGKSAAVNRELNLRQVIIRFCLYAGLVMVAAATLPFFGERLAKVSGLGQSFFGTLFIAASTSLPEIAVSVAAIRIGLIDIAIGNIFGSNIFNIAILALDDLLYKKGPIFMHTSPNHLIPVLGTIVITAVGIIGLVYKSEKKWKLGIDSAVIVVIYVAMMSMLYKVK